MESKQVIRYSSSFKRKVISDIEHGRFSSITEASAHYGITGKQTISNWLRRYGRNHLCAKVVKVQTPDKKEQIRQLKDKIKQLEQALGQTQLEKVVAEEFFNEACEQFGQDPEQFKKKVVIKLPKEPDQGQDPQ
jgi:transposase-like protein